jgi:hypothetical protein
MVQPFSVAQCVGYVAFVIGVSAFLQRSDRKLKALNATQSLVYSVHFILLGNFPASACSLLSGFRSFASLKTRSPLLAGLIIALNVAFGLVFAKSGVGWLPVIGSCLGTLGFFLMRGVRMRLVLLAGTFLWLANNILSGSIGGTALEATIATVNIVTMTRLLLSRGRTKAAKQIPEFSEVAAAHSPDGRI